MVPFTPFRVTLFLLLASPAAAQELENIADNSFLIEEAYNQEAGVVQHISNFVRDEAGDSWVYVFTQEWPLGGMRHQLSYTVPLVSPEGFGTGLGDILLNYRYQAVGDGWRRGSRCRCRRAARRTAGAAARSGSRAISP